jgi:hypothetical protein
MLEEKYKIAIVVQGPIYDIDKLIYMYSKSKYCTIVSTNNISTDNERILKENNIFIINNEICKNQGKSNFNNQVRTTFNGIFLAKKLGNKYVLKIRADMYLDNIDFLISKFILNKIYFPAYHNHDGGYLCDYILFGDINFMLKLWDIEESLSDIAPEKQLTNKFYSIRTNQEIGYIFPILFENNIIIEWAKYNKNLNSFEYDKLFSYDKK